MFRRNQKCTKRSHFFKCSGISTIFIFLKKAENLFTVVTTIAVSLTLSMYSKLVESEITTVFLAPASTYFHLSFFKRKKVFKFLVWFLMLCVAVQTLLSKFKRFFSYHYGQIIFHSTNSDHI